MLLVSVESVLLVSVESVSAGSVSLCGVSQCC